MGKDWNCVVGGSRRHPVPNPGVETSLYGRSAVEYIPVPPRVHPVAAGSALLALVGLGFAGYLLVLVPTGSAEGGILAGFGIVLGLAVGTTSLVALGEAAFLAVTMNRSNPTGWPRRLLLAGGAAGGLSSALPPLSFGLTFATERGTALNTLGYRALAPLFGAWLVLALVGFFCAVTGAAANSAEDPTVAESTG